MRIPKIAIIGRPNVGKSTLFNRLIKKRKAIIDPTPGVTRDWLSDTFEYEGRVLRIIDTGGITDEGDDFNDLIQKKTREALDLSDLVIFLVEQSNPLPIEKEYISLARKSGKKTIIAVNKCDSPEKDHFITEYYQYGFGEPIALSANHNRNVDVLLDRILELLPNVENEEESDEEKEAETLIKIAIVGKPNVGKSSMLNKILGTDRSIVSPIAGTTRDVIEGKFSYNGRDFVILDTAGIRRKAKVTQDIEYYSVNRAIKTIENADVTILAIDCVENVSEQDKKITDQIIKNGKGLIIALNKWDLVDKSDDVINEKKDLLLFKFPQISFAPIIPVSAKSGKGLMNLLKTAIGIHSGLQKRIGTSELNCFIEEVVKKYAPSSKHGVLKIYYGTQVSFAPIEFVFFINNEKLLSESYKQYAVNRFREKFNFTGIPIKIFFRDKK
ncbi:MAG TPA: ribosome biogenesis GTPase Der [Spirochaetota bacterium]|nr:ribosome biogenesis GTPase Der [Spirochaetota bacterium]